MNTVLIIGVYPPPFGGISVHIQRFYAFCNENKIKVRILSQSSGNGDKNLLKVSGILPIKYLRMFRLIVRSEENVIHFHVSTPGLKKLILLGWPGILFLRRRILVLTIHGGKFKLTNSKNNLIVVVLKKILQRFDYIICLNKNQQENLYSELILPKSRLPIIPSFIPEKKANYQVSGEIKQFFYKIKKEYKYIVTATGYAEEIYGYDLLIDAVEQIKEFSVAVILIFYTGEDKKYLDILLKRINNTSFCYQLSNIRSDEMMYSVKMSDILVRPNYIDSYGMIIGDAIHLGIPSLASDVCDRYPGAELFKVGSSEDLNRKLKLMLKNLSIYRQNIKIMQKPNYADNLLNIYKIAYKK